MAKKKSRAEKIEEAIAAARAAMQQNGSMKPRDRMHQGELPPLSHPSSQQNSFDESTGRRFAHHRRDHSGASTTSSLSVGGVSLSSHEGPHRGKFIDIDILDLNSHKSILKPAFYFTAHYYRHGSPDVTRRCPNDEAIS